MANEINTKLGSVRREHDKTENTIYFGYGSNLWKEQMSLRCPLSQYLGVGRLRDYRWMINNRGYANVVPSTEPGSDVYGLIYNLTSDDELGLDRNEGVPSAYTKEFLRVDFWPSTNGSPLDTSKDAREIEALVYIDRGRIEDDRPRGEYIHRMNMGIRDGILEGIPQDYIDRQLRPFIPIEGRKELEELARRQALRFQDEA